MTLVATQVKRRRGTNDENDAFIGAEGEITVDLTNKELRVHTGDNKVGGYGLARKDFENITDEAKNISNWSSNVSNCITEIPQDIKLELNNGTLTLKAGSKVYVPNGAGVFDTYIIPNDITYTRSGRDTLFLFVRTDTHTIDIAGAIAVSSGSTDSLAGTTYHTWYDTTNNLIKRYTTNTSVPEHYDSFPIAIIKVGETQIESIDQVFNGFGYIGSTVFALPRVKGLIPDGRNPDGSLKNIEATLDSVSINTINVTDMSVIMLLRITNGVLELKSTESQTIYYDYNHNYVVRNNNIHTEFVCCAVFFDSSGNITKFTPKTLFHAVDYNDKEFIAHQSMPSGKGVSLTVGVAGTTYTAPADGWFNFVHQGSNGEWIMLINSALEFEVDTVIYNQGFARIYMPCRKGDTVEINYSASGSYKRLNFYYAEGSI